MSIHELRQTFPGITMRYEDGGKVEVYMLDGTEVRLAPMATAEQIAYAIGVARNVPVSPTQQHKQ